MIIYDNLVLDWIHINGEKTKYLISTCGNVFNSVKKKRLKRKIDSKGYYHIILSHKGHLYDFRIHRLVALAFIKNKDSARTIVNHKDGNKLNPHVNNLEWCTYSENVIHAIQNKLLVPAKGENSGKAVITNDIARDICKLLEKGQMTQREISKALNISEGIVRAIRIKDNWVDISKDYNIDNCKIDNPLLSDEKVHEICKLLITNNFTMKEISKLTDVSHDRVLDIRKGRTFKHITDKYDLTQFKKISRYDNKFKNEILSLMKSGKSTEYIKSKLNLDKSSKTNTMLYRFRKQIDSLN